MLARPDLAEEEVQREGERGAGDQHPGEDDVEDRLPAAEGELGQGVAGRGGQQGGADRADPGVEQAVGEPAGVDAVVVGEDVDEVVERLRMVGEPEAEGAEEVGAVLGGGDDQPVDGHQEVERGDGAAATAVMIR